MEEKNKLEQSYKDEKPINIRDILTCADWEITNVSYDLRAIILARLLDQNRLAKC